MNGKKNTFYRVIFIGAVLFPGLLLFGAAQFGQAAQDAVLTVNSWNDIDDGICDETHCSLREAIKAANGQGGADTIVFSLAPNSTIGLAGSQLPPITDTLTIDGSTSSRVTISGNNRSSRIFEVRSGAVVTITEIATQLAEAGLGGGIYNEGGILYVYSSFVYGYASFGGGIYNGGGTVYIYNSGVGGYAWSGGGIYNDEGTLNIINSRISGSSDYSGAGIYNFMGTVNITGSLLAHSYSSFEGGAVTNEGGTLTISNSTIAENTCFLYRNSCQGAGIYNTGELNLINSTVSGNWSTTGYPAPPPGTGVYSSGTMNFSNTIIANNNWRDCVAGYGGVNENNFVGDGSCGAALRGDPLLGPLKDNGGPTQTYAISAISPAVDRGDSATCADPPVNNLDQRGVTRPLDGDGDGVVQCDIGAYEYDGPPPRRFYLPLFFGG